MAHPSSKLKGKAHSWMRPFTEFAIVGGLCLFILMIVIPSGTADSDNFGLSPRMLPIAATVFILLISILTLIFGLLRTPKSAEAEDNVNSKGMRGVVSLVFATLLGIFIIDQTNIVIGGTALVLLSSLAIGERKPTTLASMSAGALLLLLLVKWSGL